MIAIAEQGYEGIALSFVNYTQELPFFCDRVLPLLKARGTGSRRYSLLPSPCGEGGWRQPPGGGGRKVEHCVSTPTPLTSFATLPARGRVGAYFAGLASGFDLSTTNTLTALAGTLPMLFTSCLAPAGIM